MHIVQIIAAFFPKQSITRRPYCRQKMLVGRHKLLILFCGTYTCRVFCGGGATEGLWLTDSQANKIHSR